MSGIVAGAALGKGLDEGLSAYKSSLAWSRQKRMMQRRHQWEVRDLRKAGLNPILSAGAAPSIGSAPQSKESSFGDLADIYRKAKDSKSGRKTAKMTRQQLAGQRDLLKSQYELMVEQARTEVTKQNVNNAQAEGTRANTRRWSPFSDMGGAAHKFTEHIPGAAGVLAGQMQEATQGGGAAKAWEQQKRLNAQNLEFMKNKLNELEAMIRDNKKRSGKFREQYKADEKRSR